MKIEIKFDITPAQIEAVNFVLVLAGKWILQNQPNLHELTPGHADQIEAFRNTMLNSFLQRRSDRREAPGVAHDPAASKRYQSKCSG